MKHTQATGAADAKDNIAQDVKGPCGDVWERAKKESNWLVFKLETLPGKTKMSKKPQAPSGAPRTVGKDDAALLTHVEAMGRLNALNAGAGVSRGKPESFGLGYLPRPGSAMIGLDLDQCVNAVGEVTVDNWAMEIVGGSTPVTYVERSPSGTGLRVLCAREDRDAQQKSGEKNDVGLFADGGRFFTVTENGTARKITPGTQIKVRLQGRRDKGKEELKAKERQTAPVFAGTAPGRFGLYPKGQRLEVLDSMLRALPDEAFFERDDWREVGCAIHSVEPNVGGFLLWDRHSRRSMIKHDALDQERVWKSFGKNSGITVGTLARRALDAGWGWPQISARLEFAPTVDEAKGWNLSYVRENPWDVAAFRDAHPGAWRELVTRFKPSADLNLIAAGEVAHTTAIREPDGCDLSRAFGFEDLGGFDPLSSGAWLLKDLLPESGLGVLYGPPGIGKSFVALDLMLRLAAGKDWHDCRNKASDDAWWIFVSSEGGEPEAKKRMLGWAKENGIEPLRVRIWCGSFNWGVPLGGEPERLVEWARSLGGPVAMVVVDTLNRNMAGDENATADMTAFLDDCEKVWRQLGCFMMLVHHTGKDESKGARGASALKGAVRVELKLERNEGANGRIVVSKNNNGPDGAAWGYQLEGVDFGVDMDGDPVRTMVVAKAGLPSPTNVGGPRAIAIRAILRDLIRAKVGADATEDKFSQTKVSINEIHNELKRRVESGQLVGVTPGDRFKTANMFKAGGSLKKVVWEGPDPLNGDIKVRWNAL